MNGARGRNLAISENMPQRWGWEAVPKAEAQLGPRSYNLSMAMWFRRQAFCSGLAGIWGHPSLNTLDIQQLDALIDLQTLLRRKDKVQATASKDSNWPPSHVQKVLFWSASGWPFRGFLVWKPSLFYFFPPLLNKEDDSQTECFGEPSFLLYF